MSNMSIEVFLNEIVVPLKQNNVSNRGIWILKDCKMKVLLLSTEAVNMIGNRKEMMGAKSINILPFEGKYDWNNYAALHHRVLLSGCIQRGIIAFGGGENLVIALINMLPIFFKGEVIAVEEFIFSINSYLYGWSKSNQYLMNTNLVQGFRNFARTKSEEQIIYLLILGKKQREIAEIMGLSRSRITQLIERMCMRAGVYGWSSKMLIRIAISANYHKKIPPEFLIN